MKAIPRLLALAVLLVTAQPTPAAAPSAVNYQGRFTNAAGVPQPGIKAMSLKIYDAATAGTLLYSETIGNVTIDANGVYGFQFGASSAGTPASLANALTASAEQWLELTVDGAAQAPRQKILAAPFALMASGLPDGAISSSMIADGVVGLSKITGLGTAATLNTGTTSGTIPLLTTGGKLPAVDGSLLTGIAATFTNTTLNAILDDDAAASRTAINAQTTTRGFVNRFGRLANGTSIVTNTAPEVGSNFILHYGSGAGQTLTVVNKALEFGTTGMGYIGCSTTAPDSKFSILVVAELRLNANYTSGSTAPDLTIAVNDRPFTTLGDFLAAPTPLHAQIRSTGETNADIYTESAIIVDDGVMAFPSPPIGVKIPVRVVIDGTTVRMSMLGQTKVFRDARYSRFINPAGMGFYVQCGGTDSSTQYYWAIHSIIANSPDLENSAAMECGEYGGTITALASRGTASVQGRLRAQTTVPYLTNQLPESANDTFAFPGTGMLGYNPYFKPAPYYVGRVSGVIQRAANQLSSAVSASDTDIGIYMQALSASSGLASGSSFRWKFYGRFGANAGTKQIKIVSVGGATRFDSGALSENGTTWCMEFNEFRTGAGYGFHTKFEADTLKKLTYNNSTAVSTNAIKITAALAGDVVIDYYTCEIIQP